MSALVRDQPPRRILWCVKVSGLTDPVCSVCPPAAGIYPSRVHPDRLVRRVCPREAVKIDCPTVQLSDDRPTGRHLRPT